MDSRPFITPRERLAALADGGAFTEHDADSPSPHLARHRIVAQDDDGVVAATLAIGGRRFEALAQDARFLRGSVGARHAQKMAAAIARARAGSHPLLVLAASGGVRLHEANAAELELGRALKALVDARAAGVTTLAIGVGDVFGGMSIVAAACDALALTPTVRFGLSGPQVIALAHPGSLDPRDRAVVDAVFSAAARVRAGLADAVADDAAAMRDWIRVRLDDVVPFGVAVPRTQAQLAPSVSSASMVNVQGPQASLQAFENEVDGERLAAADARLLALPPSVRTLVITEHSKGHAASVGAEAAGLSWRLAHHACVLGLLRVRGIAVIGIVDGMAHSAAFFANALQADRLYAHPGARIVAMEPDAVLRVTGMDPVMLRLAIENDPLLGQPARHFAALGGLAMISATADAR